MPADTTSLSQLTQAQQILLNVTRALRTAADDQALLQLLAEGLSWEQLWEQARLHEVQPLLTVALQGLAPQFSPPAAWAARARKHFYGTLTRNTVLADELVRTLDAFAALQIDALPVKGVVLSETLYGSLALRPSSDLDVLVRPADLVRAREVLQGLGFRQAAKPKFEERFHAFHDPPYFRRVGALEVCLELHHGLWDAAFFVPDFAPIWARRVAACIHGREGLILAPEDTLLHLAIHRSRSALRLRFVADIARLLQYHQATLDWAYLLERAHHLGALTTLAISLDLAHSLLQAPLPVPLPDRLRLRGLRQRILRYTCGVPALFSARPTSDLSQQPSLYLRLLEQDGLLHVLRATAYSLRRTAHKHIDQLAHAYAQRSQS